MTPKTNPMCFLIPFQTSEFGSTNQIIGSRDILNKGWSCCVINPLKRAGMGPRITSEPVKINHRLINYCKFNIRF